MTDTNQQTATFAVCIDQDPWTSMRETMGKMIMDDGTEFTFSLCLSGTQLFVHPSDGTKPSLRANLRPLIEHMGHAICEQKAAKPE